MSHMGIEMVKLEIGDKVRFSKRTVSCLWGKSATVIEVNYDEDYYIVELDEDGSKCAAVGDDLCKFNNGDV